MPDCIRRRPICSNDGHTVTGHIDDVDTEAKTASEDRNTIPRCAYSYSLTFHTTARSVKAMEAKLQSRMKITTLRICGSVPIWLLTIANRFRND
jgi:hypothetical protein